MFSKPFLNSRQQKQSLINEQRVNKMTKNIAYAMPFALLLSACASDDVIVDMKGVNKQKYQQDLAECQVYSQQVDKGKAIAKNGTSGAVIGAAIGAIVGDSTSAAQGAGVGAVAGSARGNREAEDKKGRVIQNCLRGRGYKVLG
jgi:outer membrane lipoprotein SlyB